MKRFLIISALLLAVVCSVTADRCPMLLSKRPAAAAACTTVHEQNSSSISGSYSVGAVGDNTYAGQTGWDPGSSISICKLSATLTAVGTISSQSWRMEIWTLSGANLGVLQGTSDSVTGVNSWSSTAVDFTFSSPVSVSGGTQYALVVTRGATDGSNYVQLQRSASGGLAGIAAIFNGSGTRIDFTEDAKLVIYKP